MAAVPKPTKSKSTIAGPKLTESDFLEIGEKIGEASDFKNEVEITIYAHKRYESVTGIVVNVDGQQGKLKLKVGFDTIIINMNNIVSVK